MRRLPSEITINVTAKIIRFSCILIWLIPASGLAQTIPDAGELQQQQQQQQERERLRNFPTEVPPDVRPAPRTPEPPSEVTVLVKEFQFSGNTLRTNQQLQAVVAPYLNRQLNLSSLREASAAVAESYRKTGWVVRAYLPKQDITDGRVIINVQEAKFGGTIMKDPVPNQVLPHTIKGYVDRQLSHGDRLNSKALDRGLLLADDLPGVNVTGILQPGENQGETTIHVTGTDDDWLQANFGIDNGGNRGTGTVRGHATAFLNSPLKQGDQLTVATIISAGSEYGQIRYTVPIGHDGWRVGASGSLLAYRLIASEFSLLDGKGKAATVGADAFYPLLRARAHNLQLLLNYDYRQFENRSLQTRQSDYHIHEGTIGLAGNWFEKLTGLPGANFGSVAWVLGGLEQGQQQAGENPNREGFFTKLRLHLSRQQGLLPWLSLFAAFSGQKAFETLDSAEKFYLGGPNSVRAYPVNEASGSSGLLTNLELRAHLPRGFEMTGFYDIGRIYNKRSIGKSYSLKGGGLSVRWRSEVGLTLDVTWAHRLGDNPNPTSTGKDQDGSSIKNRFWLSASLAY